MYMPNPGAGTPAATTTTDPKRQNMGWAAAAQMALQGGAAGAQALQNAQANRQQVALQKQNQNWQQEGDKINVQRQLDQDAYKRANQNATNPMRMQIANALGARLGMGQFFQAPQGGFQPQQPAVAQQAANPLMAQQSKDQSWANDAMSAVYVGKSGGKMRSRSPTTGKEYTNDDRNHAQKEVIQRFGTTPQATVNYSAPNARG